MEISSFKKRKGFSFKGLLCTTLHLHIYNPPPPHTHTKKRNMNRLRIEATKQTENQNEKIHAVNATNDLLTNSIITSKYSLVSSIWYIPWYKSIRYHHMQWFSKPGTVTLWPEDTHRMWAIPCTGSVAPEVVHLPTQRTSALLSLVNFSM